MDRNLGSGSQSSQPRMTFPTLVANASPLMILPQFVEVLGKKIDKIHTELDRRGFYFVHKIMGRQFVPSV